MNPSLTKKIVDEIADEEDVDPENLDIQLQYYAPVDAIRKLASHDNDTCRLRFETPNYIVKVTGDDTVLIDLREDETDPIGE